MPKRQKHEQLGESLIGRGFDRSYSLGVGRGWKVRCSQCEALCINGIATHEHGCPNARRVREEEADDGWEGLEG